MVNKFIGMGYLSRDPVFQDFKSGSKKCSFSLGITISKDTLWLDVEAWNKIAENCSKYLTKGSLVFIDSHLKYNSWKNKQGQSQNKIIAVIDYLKVIKTKNEPPPNIPVDEIESLAKDIQAQGEVDDELESIPW